MGAFESGRDSLTGLLAKLPEGQRAQVQAIFDAAEARDALVHLGDTTLARADYSRHLDALRDKETQLNEHYERLNTWYTVNKDALDEAKLLKAGGTLNTGTGNGNSNGNPNPNPNPAPSPFSETDARRIAEQVINDQGRDYVALSAFIASMTARHQALFAEPLDALELVQNPKLGKPVSGQPGRVFSLQDAYTERYGERLAAKQKELDDKRFNEEVDRRLAERLKTQTAHPFPLRNDSSPLDVLSTKEGPAAHTLDTAVAEYERLQSARGS